MSAFLRSFQPCPAPAQQPEPPSCPLLTQAQLDAVDETMLITLDVMPLPPIQRKAHQDQLAAMRAGELRRLPTVFADL